MAFPPLVEKRLGYGPRGFQMAQVVGTEEEVKAPLATDFVVVEIERLQWIGAFRHHIHFARPALRQTG